MPKKVQRGRGRGRGSARPQQSVVPSPTPSSRSGSPASTVPQSGGEPSRTPSPAESPRSRSPAQKAKRVKKTASLSLQEEQSLAEWLAENELMYNKKLTTYKDKGRKDKMWADKATEMGKTVETLQVWYRSLRTRYGRLTKKKSGAGSAELTERDHWILAHFDFLKGHIYEVTPRTVVSIKSKLGAATAGAEETGDEEVQALTDSATQPTILDVRPKRAASAQKVVAEEERVLAGLEERGVQSVKLQEKLLDMLKPPVRVTERSAYSDWAKSVMQELDPYLWRQFQQEHSQLLYRYLDRNDKVRAQGPQQLQQPSTTQQQYTQQYPSATQSASSSQYQWQPPPQSWPSTVQPGTSVWASQSSDWVNTHMQPPQSQLTTLQPVIPSLVLPALSSSAATASTSTPASTSASSFLNVSLGQSTEGFPSTSFLCAMGGDGDKSADNNNNSKQGDV